MLGCALLGACSLLPERDREVVSFYGGREWASLTATNPAEVAGKMGGFYDVWPTPLTREQRVEAQMCLNRHARDRVVTQSGKVGAMAYRECPMTDVPAFVRGFE